MRVTMTETRRAALDGVNVVSLIAGEAYDLPAELAARYLERGQAVEQKAEGPAPANLAEGPAPQIKAPARRSTRSRGGK